MNASPLITAALLLLVSSATGVFAIDKCQVNCIGHTPGDRVEDPMNCTQYYLCMADANPTDHALACESGHHFDPMTGSCVPTPLGEDCTPKCKAVVCKVACSAPGDIIANSMSCRGYYLCDATLNATGPYYCPPDAPYFNGKNCVLDESQCCKEQCTPYCNPGDVQIIDPDSCSHYYICLEEGPPLPSNRFTCLKHQYFDMVSSRCKTDAECLWLCN